MTDVIEDVGTITATWTDPTGTVWPLSDTSDDGPGWFTTNGPAGWNATTYEIITDPLARGGTQVRHVAGKSAILTWPIYVWGDSHLQWVQRHRTLRRAFIMTLHRGINGILRVERPDQSAREIECLYQAGLEGQAGEGWLWSKDAISLYCPDGYWRGTEEISVTHAYSPGLDYQSPYPQVSPGLTLGETQIDNPGDVDAWPTWTITGPMSAMTATNLTLGLEFSLTYGLAAGEQITIVTGSDRPSVRGPAGQNLVNSLSWPTAYLWWLTPDVNDIVFNVSGGDVGTAVTMAFYPRYEGA